MPETNHGLNKSRNISISDNVNPSDLDYELAGAQTTLEALSSDEEIEKQALAVKTIRQLVKELKRRTENNHQSTDIEIAEDSTTFDLMTILTKNDNFPTEQITTFLHWPSDTISNVESNLRLISVLLLERENLPDKDKWESEKQLLKWLRQSIENLADTLKSCHDILSLICWRECDE